MWLKSIISKKFIFISMFEQLDLTSTKVIIKFSESFYWVNGNKQTFYLLSLIE